MKLTEIQQQLEENIPNSAVSKREAWKGGPKLSYLSSFHVINRMNKIFGGGNWGYDIQKLTQVGGDVQDAKGTYRVSYLAQVCISAQHYFGDEAKESAFMDITDVGYGSGFDKQTAGGAHELAAKEAVTDALKRACKSLGRSLGLALYDPTQEFVGDALPAAEKTGTPKKAVLLDMIGKSSHALISTGKMTLPELKKELKDDYGVTKKEQLTVPQAVAFVAKLGERIKAATH